MTVLERNDALDRDVIVFRVNGCVTAEIYGNELRGERDWVALVHRRLPPLVWHAMPGHE